MFFSVNVVAVVTVLLTISTVTAWKTSARFISMSTTNRDFLETSSIPVSSKTSYQSKILSNALLLNQLIVGAVVVNSLPANAVQGSIKTSSAEESKAAAQLVKRCLGAMDIIEAAVNKNNYEEVAKILTSQDFKGFENAATVLVRSDLLTAEDKVALGTIKRYGLVADALIMIGGLSGELKSGGIKMPESAGLQQSIEDTEEEEEEEEDKKVNEKEVRKYIKLSRDALNDINKIVTPILNK